MDPKRRRRHLWYAAGLCVLAVSVYARTLDVPFYLDDAHNIYANAYIRVKSLDTGALLRAALASPSVRPVANLTFALNYYAGGYDLAGFHAVNIAIHAAAGVAVYLLALVTFRLASPESGRRELASLFVAALFLVHPIQTQAVTYVVQRMTSLSALFYLVALLLFVHGRLRSGRTRVWLWAASGALWLLSLGSKQIAATFPAAVLLYEAYFFRGLDWSWLRRRWISLAGASIVLGSVGWIYLGPGLQMWLAESYAVQRLDFTPLERVLSQGRVLMFYLGLVFWPLPGRQSLLHGIEPSHSLLDPVTTLPSWLAVAALVAGAALLRRRDPIISFGIAWFFIHHAIEGSFLALDLAFEHRMYLPFVGIALAVGQIVFYRARLPTRAAPALAAALVLALGVATLVRNELWRDPVGFFEQVVSLNPDSRRAVQYLGFEQFRSGRFAEAAQTFEAILEKEPDYPEGHGNLGMALARLGDYPGAEAQYREALRLDPGMERAHSHLGMLLLAQGRLEEAHQSFLEAVRLKPSYANGHNNLGVSYRTLGQLDAAIESFRTALRIDPGSARARANLEDALRRVDRGDRAP